MFVLTRDTIFCLILQMQTKSSIYSWGSNLCRIRRTRFFCFINFEIQIMLCQKWLFLWTALNNHINILRQMDIVAYFGHIKTNMICSAQACTKQIIIAYIHLSLVPFKQKKCNGHKVFSNRKGRAWKTCVFQNKSVTLNEKPIKTF